MIDPKKRKELEDLISELSEEKVEELRRDLLDEPPPTDADKFVTIVALARSLTPAFKDELLRELAPSPPPLIFSPEDQPAGKIEVFVRNVQGQVRIDFDRRLAWIQISAPEAIQLACLIMEHAGAKIERTITPGAPPS